MNLVFLGGPGAGKGTQARRIAEQRRWAHISTGDLLREAREDDSELGRKAAGYMDRGALVPDDVMCDLVAERLGEDDAANGWILDGFPRTRPQADALDETLAEIGQKLNACIYFKISKDVLTARLTGRRTCKDCGAIYHIENNPPEREGVCDRCGGELYQRSDDNEEAAEKRIEVFEESTRELVPYYEESGRLKRLDAEGGMEEVAQRLEAALADS